MYDDTEVNRPKVQGSRVLGSGVGSENIGLRTECRGLRYIEIERGQNGRASSWWKTTTHGPRRTIHGGNRPADAKAMAGTQVMLKWPGAKQAFLP